MSGRCMEDIRIVCDFWKVYGRYLEVVWKVLGGSQEGKGCLEDVWRVDGGCLEVVWNKNRPLISTRRKVSGVCNVSESCLKVALKVFERYLRGV